MDDLETLKKEIAALRKERDRLKQGARSETAKARPIIIRIQTKISEQDTCTSNTCRWGHS